MSYKSVSKQGFTLLEIIISLGILMIISSLMLVVTGTGRASWSVASAKLYLAAQERQAASTISQELALSQYGTGRITLYSNGTGVKFKIPLVKDGALNLTVTHDLRWGDGDTEGNAIEYAMSQDGKNRLLRRILDSSSSSLSQRIIANNVESFSITNPTGTRYYNIAITFSIDRYLGTNLPTPITGNTTISVTPMN